MGFFKRFSSSPEKCNFESDTSECSLVQQLRDKQEERQTVDALIDLYDLANPSVNSYIELTSRLLGSSILNSQGYFGVSYMLRQMQYISMEEIENAFEEVKSLKKHCDELHEKHSRKAYSYTIRYTASTGETIYERTYPIKKPTKRRQEPELEAGDTAALDDFLGGFKHEKK